MSADPPSRLSRVSDRLTTGTGTGIGGSAARNGPTGRSDGLLDEQDTGARLRQSGRAGWAERGVPGRDGPAPASAGLRRPAGGKGRVRDGRDPRPRSRSDEPFPHRPGPASGLTVTIRDQMGLVDTAELPPLTRVASPLRASHHQRCCANRALCGTCRADRPQRRPTAHRCFTWNGQVGPPTPTARR